jgi:hypothetical protein
MDGRTPEIDPNEVELKEVLGVGSFGKGLHFFEVLELSAQCIVASAVAKT